MRGIGIDIIEIDRIREAVDRFGNSFLEKVFTPLELDYCRRSKALKYPELAVRFAAKEAYAKAIGTGISGFARKNKGLGWKDIEVVNNAQGKPLLALKGKISKTAQISLSHSRDYAVACVYVEK